MTIARHARPTRKNLKRHVRLIMSSDPNGREPAHGDGETTPCLPGDANGKLTLLDVVTKSMAFA